MTCLVVLLAALMVCAGGCSAEGDLREETTLHYAQTDEPRRLDPAFVKDLYEGIVSGFIYEGLVIFGAGAEVRPGLAEGWGISPDGRVYTFNMRRDARFSNGRPVTAEDVIYSFTRVLRSETNSQRKWVLDRIEGAKALMAGDSNVLTGLTAVDPYTVRIELTAAYPPFLMMLAMPNAVVIPKGSAGLDKPDPAFDRNPIGSGPWVLKKWLHDQRLVFRRNPHYRGGGPELDNLVYHIQTEDSVRYRQFEAGNLDIIQVGFQAHEAWQNDPHRARLTTAVQELRTDYIGLNCSRKPLDDLRVRAAISQAVDKEMIFRSIQKGRGIVATGPVPPGIEGYQQEEPQYPYSLEKAKALLAAAGVSQKLKLTLVYREDPLNGEIAQAVMENLKAAGIEVSLLPRDQAALRQMIHEGASDLFLGSWTLDYPDIENSLYPPFHSSNIPRQGNQTHFRNAEVDAVLSDARAEGNNQRRIDLYRRAEHLVKKQAPWVPLFHRKVYYAVQPDVVGWVPALIYNGDRFNQVKKQP